MDKSMITKLSPPWYVYHNKVKAMFGRDPQVSVRELAKMDDGSYSYLVLVSELKKAAAIKYLLPAEVDFGNVRVNATILGPNENSIAVSENAVRKKPTELLADAFTGNPIYVKFYEVSFYGLEKCYCIFAKEVIQFYSDDLTDYLGNCNTLAEDIAREIFNPEVARFIDYCTYGE